MKKLYPLALFLLGSSALLRAQSTYNNTDYAVNGDTIYLTQAALNTLNFDTTGTNVLWDYSTLTGVTQDKLVFRAPNQTGFSIAQWPYIYNSSNTNLSSTTGNTISAGSLQLTNPNDYFHISSSQLGQKASAYDVVTGAGSFSIKNVFTSPDVLLQFPLNYGDTYSSVSGFTSSITGVYYRAQITDRSNNVEGWGTLITPYGTFNNCLKIRSDVMQIDTLAVDTISFPTDTVYYREFKWVDPSEKYTLLTVKQTLVGSVYVTQSIEYLDSLQYFQPTALFAYAPVLPLNGDTVYFQNLSQNAVSYNWDFGDPASGTNNTSTALNPTHIYAATGVYPVQLIVSNGLTTDTVVLPVVVGSTVMPTASFTYVPATTIYTGDTVFFTNTSTEALAYSWIFDDPGSGSNVSVMTNPYHVYNLSGTYNVMLAAVNNVGADTSYQIVIVDSLMSTGFQLEEQGSFRLFPNPAQEQFNVLVNEHFTGVLNVYDVNGKCVYTTGTIHLNKQQSLTVNMSGFAEGVYVAELNAGGHMKRTKIILTK